MSSSIRLSAPGKFRNGAFERADIVVLGYTPINIITGSTAVGRGAWDFSSAQGTIVDDPVDIGGNTFKGFTVRYTTDQVEFVLDGILTQMAGGFNSVKIDGFPELFVADAALSFPEGDKTQWAWPSSGYHPGWTVIGDGQPATIEVYE